MNNLLPSFITLHQKYDLKGSTYKRKASKYERRKESPTYKDLDFIEHHPEGIFLEAETYTALMKTIQRDCRVLESFKIMDYSLLVGIHNLDLAAREKQDKVRDKLASVACEAAAEASRRGLSDINESRGGGVGDSSENEAEANTNASNMGRNDAKMLDNNKSSYLTRSKSMNRQRLAAYSTAMESIQAEVEPIDEEEDVPYAKTHFVFLTPNIRFSFKVPVYFEPYFMHDTDVNFFSFFVSFLTKSSHGILFCSTHQRPGGIPARNCKGERLLLFMGIIDILQSYRLKKKFEHTFKSLLTDGVSPPG